MYLKHGYINFGSTKQLNVILQPIWLELETDQQKSSRVCAVAQYAVLEANGKVNGIGEILHPSPSKPLDQFGCCFKYITTSTQGVDVPNLIKIDSAIAVLRMREKKWDFTWVFTARRNARIASAVLAMTFPSVCPSVCHTPVLC